MFVCRLGKEISSGKSGFHSTLCHLRKDKAMSQKIGFIGVGTMGKPMATNLIKHGFEVTICAHQNNAPIVELQGIGAKVVKSPREVAETTEVVITCLPTSKAVDEVFFSKYGIASANKTDLVVIDTSTINPLDTQSFAKQLSLKGFDLLDAPMSGGQVGAIAGMLVFMVGGKQDKFELCQEIFAAMGKKAYYVGPSGSGEVVKICNNLMLGINMVGVCEAFTLGVKAGVDSAVLAEIVQASSGGSAVIERYFPKTIAKNQYTPGFMLKLMAKDMNLALNACKDMGVTSLVGSVAGQVFDMVKATGKGDMDFAVVATLYQELAGVVIGKAE
jgi:3-hydroxyisobutyrate dehydrogenase